MNSMHNSEGQVEPGNFSLSKGIISVLQTPFDETGAIDYEGLARLIENAIDAGVSGFLAPAVASEVAHLTRDEREGLVRWIAEQTNGRVPFIVGASSDKVEVCQHFAALAKMVGADAYLVAVPPSLYSEPDRVSPFFQEVTQATDLPLVIQDLEFNGPGLDMEAIKRLRETLPTLMGFKIETVPAGPKYTAVREAFGRDFFIAGGWAIMQMIEALDRGVDAMIPESAMVKVYSSIFQSYAHGKREQAVHLFRQLLPVLAFANQDLGTSIAFFKRLLVRKGIFQNAVMRYLDFAWDAYQLRIADELIDYYLELERAIS
jgi:4-hydroxy-tetrahydrodipicolinate synthase